MTQKINFIAEISGNHMGSKQRALELIDAAAGAGATSVKFQTYTADTMTLDIDEFNVDSGHELWGGRTLYSLYEEAHTPWEWHEELFTRCRERNVVPFSSPFDVSAVEFLEKLDAPMYKIASLETSDLTLIKAVASTGKPLIVSTGATMWDEIEDLVSVIRKVGNQDLTLLVCTSAYPAKALDSHIKRMKTLKDYFKVKVGLSDHTPGIGVSIAAIALGASAIEKHITLRRADGGADGAFSMEPSEFASLVQEGSSANEALGNSEWSMQDSEKESRRLRRSLYVVQDVKAGDLVTPENLRAIRPGAGASPKYYEVFIGKHFKVDGKAGTPMSAELISETINE